MQFINETAYIQIALRGKNFCMAAWDGFQAVLNNGLRYMVVAGVGKLMMLIGQILIAVATTAAFYCLITFVSSIKSNIIEPLYLLAVLLFLYLDCLHHLRSYWSLLYVSIRFSSRYYPCLLHCRLNESSCQRIKSSSVWSKRTQLTFAQRLIQRIYFNFNISYFIQYS